MNPFEVKPFAAQINNRLTREEKKLLKLIDQVSTKYPIAMTNVLCLPMPDSLTESSLIHDYNDAIS